MKTDSQTSYTNILKTSTIASVGSVLSIAVGLVRTKVFALLLGPTGIGLYGLFQALQTTARSASMLGLGTSGNREVAAHASDPAQLRYVSTALVVLAGGAGAITLLVMILFRDAIASAALGDGSLSYAVIVIGFAVFSSAVSVIPGALLGGLRRITELSLSMIWSAVTATVVGVTGVWILGTDGLLWSILATSLAPFFVAVYFLRNDNVFPNFDSRAWLRHVSPMLSVGVAFAIVTTVNGFVQIYIRSSITESLGIEAVGLFQAGYTISMIYLTVVLQAMAMDYFPRLTQAFKTGDMEQPVREQSDVALLLATPAILVLVSFAPLSLTLLYASEFAEASQLLRIHVVGDIFKIAANPLAYVLLAAGHGRMYMGVEFAWSLVYVGSTHVLLPILGLEAAGVGYLIAYIVYFSLLAVLLKQKYQITNTRAYGLRLGLVVLITGGLLLISYWNEWAAMIVGGTAGLAFFFGAFRRIADILGRDHRLVKPFSFLLNKKSNNQ